MALSNQSYLPAFSSPRKVNLKIGLVPEDDLGTENGQIPEDYLPGMAKSLKMTSRSM
jgi:hypothetical protein